MDPKSKTGLIDKLRRSLAAQNRTGIAQGDMKPAAVLIPFYWDADEWHLLFTRRTDLLESHSGQVSFPGGAIEPKDKDAQEAALREAEEEIGLQPKDVEVIGQLENSLTITNFEIAPVVGTIPWPYPLRINQIEVANVFGVPLSWLANSDNLEIKDRYLEFAGENVPVYYFHPYHGEIIWGATARITINLLKMIGLDPSN